MGIVTEVKENSILFLDQDQTILRMTETMQDDDVTVELEGDLRGDTAYAFGDELITLVLLGKNLTVNMAKMKGISSSSCSQLLAVQQAIDNNDTGSLKLIKLPAVLLEALNASGLTQLLMIE